MRDGANRGGYSTCLAYAFFTAMLLPSFWRVLVKFASLCECIDQSQTGAHSTRRRRNLDRHIAGANRGAAAIGVLPILLRGRLLLGGAGIDRSLSQLNAGVAQHFA